MKRVLNKITGLSLVLAMVVSLFMPMVVVAQKSEFAFDPNGGTILSKGISQIYYEDVTNNNGKLTKSQAGNFLDSYMYKMGYVFVGWVDENGNVYNTVEGLTSLNASDSTIVLQAQWVKEHKQCNVTVKHMCGSEKLGQNIYTILDETMFSNNSELVNYIKNSNFKGYTVESAVDVMKDGKKVRFFDIKDTASQTVDSDAEIIVNYDKEKHAVTYYDNDGTNDNSAVEVEYGKKADGDVRPTKERAGYVFDIWCTDEQGLTPYDFSSFVLNDLNLYARWKNLYKVTVKHVCGSTLLAKKDFDVPYGEQFGLRSKELESYIMTNPKEHYVQHKNAELKDVSGSSGRTFQVDQAGSQWVNNDAVITVYYDKEKHAVTYYDNDGTDGNTALEVEHGEKAGGDVRPTKEREGYVFDGWCMDEQGLNPYDFNNPVLNDLNLYAHWKKVYKIIDGNYNVDIQKGMDLVVRANGEVANFQKLLIDGKEVDKSNYEITSGSTIARVKASYLDTLPAGNHKVTFVYNDGEVSVDFSTVKDSAVVEPSGGGGPSGGGSPKTGDSGIGVWVALLLTSTAGVAALIRYLKKVN